MTDCEGFGIGHESSTHSRSGLDLWSGFRVLGWLSYACLQRERLQTCEVTDFARQVGRLYTHHAVPPQFPAPTVSCTRPSLLDVVCYLTDVCLLFRRLTRHSMHTIGPYVFAFAIGCLGAVVPEALHWHRIARRGRWPQYASSIRYWLVTLAVILIGGAVAALVSPPGSSTMQLLLLGTVGPNLLQSAAQNQRLAPQDGQPHLGADGSWLRDFLAL